MVAVLPEIERLALDQPIPAVKLLLEMAHRVQDGTSLCLVFIGD